MRETVNMLVDRRRRHITSSVVFSIVLFLHCDCSGVATESANSVDPGRILIGQLNSLAVAPKVLGNEWKIVSTRHIDVNAEDIPDSLKEEAAAMRRVGQKEMITWNYQGSRDRGVFPTGAFITIQVFESTEAAEKYWKKYHGFAPGWKPSNDWGDKGNRSIHDNERTYLYAYMGRCSFDPPALPATERNIRLSSWISTRMQSTLLLRENRKMLETKRSTSSRKFKNA